LVEYRSVTSMISAQGMEMKAAVAELKQQMAEFELRLTRQLLELSNRVARLE
jgi:hypothetical protein